MSHFIQHDGTLLYETGMTYIKGGNQDKLHDIVELTVEPWYFQNNRTTTIFLLDDYNNRVLLFGKQTIQM